MTVPLQNTVSGRRSRWVHARPSELGWQDCWISDFMTMKLAALRDLAGSELKQIGTGGKKPGDHHRVLVGAELE
jgi:hypothetical protein